MLFTDFITEIEENDLMQKGDSVVAAVSGGADSVCLLHLLYRLRPKMNLQLICAHVNHGLRKEADADAVFVEELCKAWSIPFLLHEENVGDKARREKISVELAGREVRYRFFRSLGADIIATAHNKNDTVESVLLHLIRGCGLDGLCGIPKKREDGICRPLLRFTRNQIEAYLAAHNLYWREDLTNRDTLYTRNKIRHMILPLIEEINPSFINAIGRMTNILADENVFLQTLAEKHSVICKENDITFFDLNELNKIPLVLQRRIVRQVVDDFSEVNAIINLIEKKNGSVCVLSGGKIAEKEYDKISVYTPQIKSIAPLKLPAEGAVEFGEYRIIVGESGLALPKKDYIVRTRQNGDVFSPDGMLGRKKIKDYFIDMKIPRRLRDQIPIITCNGVIAAVGDFRRSQEFIPQNGDVLHIKIERIKHV